ncbi:MAG: hypothetical protein KBT03_13490 [Bacteroidales bacterium]|nr:hypothetical protein [Candidatus Scybalousia scybalohippi]
MEFNSKVEYSIEDWKKYQDDESIDLALGRIEFLSDKPNTHHHVYSLDVLKQYAPSYLGKFVVSKYDKYEGDASTHVHDQQIVGYIPTTQEVKFEQKADGYWYASVDVVISKIYAPEIYQLFTQENYRSVSVEQLVGFTKETENYADGAQDKIVVGFEGIGITILGKKFNPSVGGANIQLTRMSEDSIQEIEQEYVKYSQKDSNVVNMQEIKEQLDRIENKLSKEVTMAENTQEVLAEEVVEEVEMTATETETENVEEVQNAEISEQPTVMSEVEVMAEEEAEAENEAEEAEAEEETMACGEKETKMAELESKLTDAEAKISQYEAELEELRKFKSDIQMSEKRNIVAKTLAQVKEFVDEQTYEGFSQSGETCEYENIGAWKNEVLASIAEKTLEKMSQLTASEEGISEIGLPVEADVKTSIYD